MVYLCRSSGVLLPPYFPRLARRARKQEDPAKQRSGHGPRALAGADHRVHRPRDRQQHAPCVDGPHDYDIRWDGADGEGLRASA